MLRNNMSEAQEGRFVIKDMVLPVVKAVLHFIYTDSLPEDMEGPLLEVPMAQHLLVAADLYQLTRLRRICERRLCETVDVETAATTLALAEQNHAEVRHDCIGCRTNTSCAAACGHVLSCRLGLSCRAAQ